MKVKCWKCGSTLRFDEAKIHRKARVRCPNCKVGMLLEMDPNSADPRFFVTPEPAGPDSSSPQNQTYASEPEKAEMPSMPGMAELTKLRNGKTETGDDTGSISDHLESMRKSATKGGLPFDMKSRIVRPQTLPPSSGRKRESEPEVDPLSANAEAASEYLKANMPSLGGTLNLRDDSVRDPRESAKLQNPLLVPQTVAQAKGSGVSLVTWIIVLAGLIGIVVFLMPERFGLVESGSHVAKSYQIHPGERALLDMVKKYPEVTGDPLQMMKKAETLYKTYDSRAYQKAHDIFRQALVLDPRNPGNILRYVETWALTHPNPRNMHEVRKLIDIADYGLTVTEELAGLHRAKARLYLLINQNSRAYESALKAYRLNNQDPENMVVLAQTELAEKPERAIERLSELVDRSRSFIPALKPLAEAYDRIGNFSKMEETLEIAGKLDSSKCLLCLELADMYLSIGEYERAGSVYEQVAARQPDSAEGLIGQGFVAYRQKQALDVVRSKLSGIPAARVEEWSNSQQVRLYAAQAFFALHDHDRDTGALMAKRAHSLDPEDPTALYLNLLTLVTQAEGVEDSDDIRRDIERLTLDFAGKPEAWVLAGLFERNVGNLRTATDHFKKAISVAPDYYHAHFLLAELFLDALNVNSAFAAIEHLNRYPVDYWDDHLGHGLLADTFDYEEAFLEKLKKVDAVKVDLDRRNRAVALAAYLLNLPNEAENGARAVLDNIGSDATANAIMGLVQVKQGKLRDARHYLSQILGSDRHNALGNRLFSKVLALQNRPGEAIDRLTLILKVHGGDAGIQALLAILSAREGDIEQARVAARMAYRLDPDSQQVRYARYLARI